MRPTTAARVADRRDVTLPRPPRAAGFTLIETLVALAVLGTVMSVVYGMVSDQLRRIGRGDEQVTLALFAQNLLARTDLDLGRPGAPNEGSTADGLRWTVERIPVPLPPAPSTDAGLGGTAAGTDPGPDDGSPDTGGAGGADGGSASLLPQPTPDTVAAGGDQTAPGGPTTNAAASGTSAQRIEPQLFEVRVTAENARGEHFTLSTLRVEAKP